MNVEPLVVGRVIGEVVDMFVPKVPMCVYYASKHVTNGCDINPSFAANPPRITLTGTPHQLYTLVRHFFTSLINLRLVINFLLLVVGDDGP